MHNARPRNPAIRIYSMYVVHGPAAVRFESVKDVEL